jgi:hypothetical protein
LQHAHVALEPVEPVEQRAQVVVRLGEGGAGQETKGQPAQSDGG